MSSKLSDILKLINRYFLVKTNTQNTIVVPEHFKKPQPSDRSVFKIICGESSKNDFNNYQKLGHNKSSS